MKKALNVILTLALVAGFVLAVTTESAALGIVGTIVYLAAGFGLVHNNSDIITHY